MIAFTNYAGKQINVKDVRPISSQTLAFEIDKKENDLLDEIASRKEVYGNMGELQSWRIFDLNIVRLAEVNFDLTRLKRIKIPV